MREDSLRPRITSRQHLASLVNYGLTLGIHTATSCELQCRAHHLYCSPDVFVSPLSAHGRILFPGSLAGWGCVTIPGWCIVRRGNV